MHYDSIKETDKFNSKFESYYRAQELMEESEFSVFLETLKRPLPTTFRITGHGDNLALVREQLVSEHIPRLEALRETTGVGVGVGVGAGVSVPKPISWYPDELAWQLETDRALVRREPAFAAFYRWLVEAAENGDVTRQEAVSMIPPMLLDVAAHHIVLDVCAAPGSKTSQLVEQMHKRIESESSAARAVTGAVVANDINKDRAYLLFHQVKRFDSPALLVCNHDGSFFPNLHLADAPHAVEFDCILADVPCTGDGTLRKNIDVWKTWSPRAGLGLHPIQIRILERSLLMLKTGGRLVYSTCSFNPVENEAVVAHVLTKYAGRVRIVNVADRLAGLKYRPGLTKWHVSPGASVASVDRVPPSACCQPEYASLGLEQCVRILPQDQNSGGFFIVLLEKTGELGGERSRRRERGTVDPEDTAPAKRSRVQDEEPFTALPMSSPIVENVIEFFGLDREALARGAFLIRSTKELPKTLYFASETVGRLINGGNDGFRVINTGVKCFELYDNKNAGYACPYRMTTDALATMLPLMTRRVFAGTAGDLLALLASEDSVATSVFSEGLQAQLAAITTGGSVFVLASPTSGRIAIPVWASQHGSKAFVARPDRPKLTAHLQKLLNVAGC